MSRRSDGRWFEPLLRCSVLGVTSILGKGVFDFPQNFGKLDVFLEKLFTIQPKGRSPKKKTVKKGDIVPFW